MRIVTPGGMISTFAGNGNLGIQGDGGLAINAQLATPVGLAVDPSGNRLHLGFRRNSVRMVTPGRLDRHHRRQRVTAGYSGDGGPATAGRDFNTVPRASRSTLKGIFTLPTRATTSIRLLQFVSPVPGTGMMVNAASNLPGPVAPGEG